MRRATRFFLMNYPNDSEAPFRKCILVYVSLHEAIYQIHVVLSGVVGIGFEKVSRAVLAFMHFRWLYRMIQDVSTLIKRYKMFSGRRITSSLFS